VIEPLTLSFEVKCGVRHAFEVWTSRVDTWWPTAHTHSGEKGVRVYLERHIGGRIYERTTDGTEHEWGEVTVWDPPVRFGYLWHLRSQREVATDVDINFVEVDAGLTRVDIVHSGWDRLGEGGEPWQKVNQGGWAGVIPDYVAAAESAAN
jgi:hypothetical protein